MRIKRVFPRIALPGGVVRIEVEGLVDAQAVRVEVGGAEAKVVGASPDVLTVRIPDEASDGVTIYGAGRARAGLRVGRLAATDLHSVANPVVDSSGSVYCTYSGARGEKVPFCVFVIRPEGEKQPFLADIMNPTGLAIGPDRRLYISSRHTGAVYRSTLDKQVDKFVDGLGLATGLAFDLAGNLLVGDRSGTIYRIAPDSSPSILCELEPSVSAYHLALNSQGDLFVAGPTLSTQDCIYRVSPDGRASVYYRGLGRPQGMVFDPKGRLQVAASHKGRKGVFTFVRGVPEWTISGPMLVGLAYSPDGSALYLAEHANLYRVDL
jgi:sugar lactone lactonase YvrE